MKWIQDLRLDKTTKCDITKHRYISGGVSRGDGPTLLTLLRYN